MSGSCVVCSVGVDDELVGAVDFEPVERAQDRWRHDARRPDDEVGLEERAGGGMHAAGIDRGDALTGMHRDVEPLQQLRRRRRELLGQRRQDAWRGLEQREADVAHRVEVLESIAGMRARGLPDLGGELDPGGTGADDDDVDLRRLTGRRTRVRTHTGRQQAPMEALGIDPHVERDRVLGYTGHAEVVADAADTDDERVVAQRAARQDFLALDRLHCIERYLAVRAIEPGQRSLREPESMPVRDRRVVEVVRVGVHAPGCNLMQQWLPYMGVISVHQRHAHRALASVAVTEPRRQRQAAGSTSDDHDSMRIGRAHARCPLASTVPPARTTLRHGLKPIA